MISLLEVNAIPDRLVLGAHDLLDQAWMVPLFVKTNNLEWYNGKMPSHNAHDINAFEEARGVSEFFFDPRQLFAASQRHCARHTQAHSNARGAETPPLVVQGVASLGCCGMAAAPARAGDAPIGIHSPRQGCDGGGVGVERDEWPGRPMKFASFTTQQSAECNKVVLWYCKLTQ